MKLLTVLLLSIVVWIIIIWGIKHVLGNDNSEVMFYETTPSVTHDSLDPSKAASSSVRRAYVYPDRQVVERRVAHASRSYDRASEPSSGDPTQAYASVPESTPEARVPVPAGSGDVWTRLANCESGGRWDANTGNGYYGGIQFSLRSWQWVGGPAGYPHEHPREVQVAMGQRLVDKQGWAAAFPACSRKLGLR